MTVPCPSFEATLLLAAPVTVDPDRLAEDMGAIALAHDEVAVPVPTGDPAFWLFELGEMQILIAASEQPLVADHFLDARRPAAAMLTEVEVLSRLTAHRHSLTVLVSPEPEAAAAMPAGRLKRLCWQVTECLRAEFGADLVFWAESDTLYSGAEFDNADLFADPRRAAPAALPAPKRSPADVQREIEARALTYIYGQIVQGAHKPKPKQHGLQALIRNGAAGFAQTEPRVRRATATMCSTASVGLGALQLAAGGLPIF